MLNSSPSHNANPFCVAEKQGLATALLSVLVLSLEPLQASSELLGGAYTMQSCASAACASGSNTAYLAAAHTFGFICPPSIFFVSFLAPFFTASHVIFNFSYRSQFSP